MRLYLSRKYGRDAHLRTVAGLPGTVLLSATGTTPAGAAGPALVAPSAAAAVAAESDPLVREAAVRAARDRLPVALKNRFDRDMFHASLVHGYWPPLPRVDRDVTTPPASGASGASGSTAAAGATEGVGTGTLRPSEQRRQLPVAAVSDGDAFQAWLGLPGVPAGVLPCCCACTSNATLECHPAIPIPWLSLSRALRCQHRRDSGAHNQA